MEIHDTHHSEDLTHRVLFVEDDPTMRGLMRAFTQMIGVPAVQVESAEQAIAYLTKYGRDTAAPRVVVVDLDLHYMDGVSLCRMLLERGLFPLDRVVVLSGGQTLEERTRLSELGVRRVLHKPFLLEELRKAIGVD